MADRDDVRAILERVERRVQPRADFADALLDDLLEQFGTGAPRSVLTPVHRRVTPRVRRAILIAAALLAALAIVAILLAPLRNLAAPKRPADIGPFRSTPAFVATYRAEVPPGSPADPNGPFYCVDCGPGDTPDLGPDFRFTITYASDTQWRIDDRQGQVSDYMFGGPGAYLVWNGTKLFTYNPVSNGFEGFRVTDPGQPFSPTGLLSWDDPRAGWKQLCEHGTVLPTDSVAGRTAYHVHCPTPPGWYNGSVDVWVDAGTGLVLKLSSPPGNDQWRTTAPKNFTPRPLEFVPGETLVATSVSLPTSIASSTFPTSPPPGTLPGVRAAKVRAPTSFRIGSTIEPTTLPRLGGGGLTIPAAGRPTFVYVWADWCEPPNGSCTDAALAAFDAARARFAAAASFVDVVQPAKTKQVVATVDRVHVRTPIAVDRTGFLRQTVGLIDEPALLVFDASGRYLGGYAGTVRSGEAAFTSSQFDAVVRAVLNGSPLPHLDGIAHE